MELTAVKELSAFALMILTFLSSMLPLCVFRQPLSLYQPVQPVVTRRRVLSFLSCFAGGVFLGTCLLHLFPDVIDQVHLMVEALKIDPKYPISEFLLGFGFMTILIIEQIAISFKEDVHTEAQNRQTADRNQTVYVQEAEESAENIRYVNTTYGSIQGEHEHSEYNISFRQEQNSVSTFHSLLILYALSLHSLFEGLAIGLQTTVKDELRILIAVLFHKCIIAFSLGLKFSNSEMNLLDIIKSNVFFSLTSPAGILIGLTVMNLATGVTLIVTSAVLQGLAAGTFLYVTVFEVLHKEFGSERDSVRILKILSVLIGYCMVTFLVIFLPD